MLQCPHIVDNVNTITKNYILCCPNAYMYKIKEPNNQFVWSQKKINLSLSRWLSLYSQPYFHLSRYWDIRQPQPVHVQQLPERCYALSLCYPLMVVGTAERNIIVFNLQNPQVSSSVTLLDDLVEFWLYTWMVGNLELPTWSNMWPALVSWKLIYSVLA